MENWDDTTRTAESWKNGWESASRKDMVELGDITGMTNGTASIGGGKTIHEELHQLNIIEKKTVDNVVGKYVPDYVREIGERREIATNGRFFFN